VPSWASDPVVLLESQGYFSGTRTERLIERVEIISDRMAGTTGFEPTNLTVSPDDSIGFSSLNPRKMAHGSLVLDRNWTEIVG